MIRAIRESDAGAVAALHQRTLRSDMSGVSGRRLLACNYRALASGFGGVGYVAISADGQLMGFVCGVWSPSQLRSALLRLSWMRLLIWGALHALFHPGTLMGFVKCMAAPRARGGAPACPAPPSTYELRPIAIAPECRGDGTAAHLLERLLGDASGRGYVTVTLKTECDNGRANAFYVKHGFVKECVEGGYNHYRISVHPAERRQ